MLDKPLQTSEGESLIKIHLDEDSQQALEFELAPVGCFGGDNTVMTYSQNLIKKLQFIAENFDTLKQAFQMDFLVQESEELVELANMQT